MHTTSIDVYESRDSNVRGTMMASVEISLLTVCTGETSHCALENGADLHVNERQKIRHYRVRSTEERRRMPNRDFFTSRGAYVNLRYIAMLYTYSIGNQRWIHTNRESLG